MIKDAIIQDITKTEMPTVTEMVITSYSTLTGNLLYFKHPDRSETVIAMKEGWNLSVIPREE